MRTRLLALLAAGLLLGADAKEEAAKETKKLQGTWSVTAVKVGGKALPEKDFMGDRLVIKGNLLRMINEKKKGGPEFTFTIDPSKKPKHIDMTDTKQKKTVPCIYTLEGDEFRMCIPLVEKGKKEPMLKRPESVDAKDKPQICFTARKQK
jgi:uncharacterized protein (TIGR03067 family)